MKAINFVVCLCMAFMLSTFNSLAAGEDFKSFLHKFTSSASFQYSRIKFPLKSPIVLLQDDGETEQTFPFTRDNWALLDSETLKEGRITEEEGGVYISRFTRDEPAYKEFEAGYDESEPSLRVVFELVDGNWYATCLSGSWKRLSVQCRRRIKALRSFIRNICCRFRIFAQGHVLFALGQTIQKSPSDNFRWTFLYLTPVLNFFFQSIISYPVYITIPDC